MRWCVRRTRADRGSKRFDLSEVFRPARLAVAAAPCLLALALAAPTTAASAPTLKPLLPLSRGQLLVLLGGPGQWLPESGTPITVTLLSGKPAAGASGDSAFLTLQRAGSRCASTPAGDHVTPFVLQSYYANGDLIAHERGSPFTGAQTGDYAARLGTLVVHQVRKTRACVWLGTSPTAAKLALSQAIPLLNGLFAASITALSGNGATRPSAYTLNAVDVSREFSYKVATVQCGSPADDASGLVPVGELATESIALSARPCTGDDSRFSFSTTAGPIGALTYTAVQATASPPGVSSLGGCELDPLNITTTQVATTYLTAVGCTVRRFLVGPFQPGIPRGWVVAAQVDGGIAEVAPHGTAIDLVLNGKPPA